ncbi:right-handed parallel beta-helix repeat-containing protein [Vibrio variabilis]|uniref:right-handed parallel beta-helix repeat-containing protein n=1 Tax=Vibrio variabilis TaxID=990271 RepID=UPI000DD63DCB|nr:right-handed parallel beta-helix repeat-containing protein [Vibrio variabilis]
MTGALKATIRNNSFFGVRDAAIYVSAGGESGEYGDHFTLVNNYVERAYDGITSKRGADNIKMQNNVMHDVVVGLSIKRVYDGWTATNINISDNSVSNSVRPISVERANDVVIDSNRIDNLGSIVANSPTPTNKYGKQYEGIALNGVQGSNRVTNNIINGITQDGSRERDTTTWGIVLRPEDGRETTNVTIEGNIYFRLDKWVNRI